MSEPSLQNKSPAIWTRMICDGLLRSAGTAAENDRAAEGWTEQQKDGQMDGAAEGWTDGQSSRGMDRWTESSIDLAQGWASGLASAACVAAQIT